jgi:hypothetical protein
LISRVDQRGAPAFRDDLRPLLGADVIEAARLRKAAKVKKAGVLSGDAT